MKKEIIYILYDERYRYNEDKAVCFEVCDTLKEAKENCADYGNNTVIVKAETLGREIINSKIIN